MTKDEDCFFSEWFYDNSEGKFGKERIENFLQKQSEKSASTRAYYEKVLQDKILQECRFDSNSDVRAFAERIIRFRKN